MALSYSLFIEPEVHAARGKLPGHVRQRIRRAMEDLSQAPRPAGSRTLDISKLDLPSGIELRRLRIEAWRLVYAVNDEEGWIWLLGVHQRPPYDYADLPDVIDKLRR